MFGGIKDAIRIAGFKNQRAVFNIPAPDIDIQHRQRHAHRPLGKFAKFDPGQAFAAHLTIQIRRGHAERFEVVEIHWNIRQAKGVSSLGRVCRGIAMGIEWPKAGGLCRL